MGLEPRPLSVQSCCAPELNSKQPDNQHADPAVWGQLHCTLLSSRGKERIDLHCIVHLACAFPTRDGAALGEDCLLIFFALFQPLLPCPADQHCWADRARLRVRIIAARSSSILWRWTGLWVSIQGQVHRSAATT